MSNIIFIEDFDNQCLTELKDHTIIALTPMVMYELDKRRIPYRIPEDYFIWEETKEYKRKFLHWVYDVEMFINQYYSLELHDLDMPITYHCMTMLKNVVDAYVRTRLQFDRIIEEECPDEMWYLIDRNKLNKEVIDEELYFKGESLFYNFFKIKEESDRCAVTMIINTEYKVKKTSNWRDNRIIRFVYDYLRYYMWLPSDRRRSNLFHPVLFASYMPYVRTLRKERTSRIDILEDFEIEYKRSNFKIEDSLFDNFPIELKNIDIRLRSRLYTFINQIVPKVFAYADSYSSYFKENVFSCIVFNRRNKLYQYGALIAAKKTGLRSVYIRHGWDAYDVWWRRYTRFQPYDYYIVNNKKEDDFYRDKVFKWRLGTNILKMAYFKWI